MFDRSRHRAPFHPGDIGLPGELDGDAVARALRPEPALAGTYLLALTGYAGEEDQSRARDAGFDRHLTKPVPFDELQRVPAAPPVHS